MTIASLINVSKLGVLSSQSALQVVSHNIANVNTEGFSRQTAVLGTNATNAQRYGLSGTNVAGDGVMVNAVTRQVDALVENRILLGEQELGRLTTRDRFLMMVEDEFNDLDGDGFSQRMASFFEAADSLADNPLNPVAREEFVARSETLGNFANRMHSSLSELALPVDGEITVAIQDINTRLRSLQQVNDAIVRQGTAGSDPALDLMDKRQTMIRELSELMDVQVLDQPNSAGITLLSGSGRMLMDQGFSAQFERGSISNVT
ncbi:MAG: flagellar hook-associated protein FlgK, partial [Magnetococcales bacterium]|nr:flagellar hook-associated protein FlgK [Magnetococcales bacterium]